MRVKSCVHNGNPYHCILIFNGLQQRLKMYAPAFELWDLTPPKDFVTVQFAKLTASCL